jgi:tetratricopeptide (TPR) repeat protein
VTQAIAFLERSDWSNVRTIVALVLSALLIQPPAAAGQRLADERLHALVEQGIDLTLQQDYEAADSVFRYVAREFPDHPAGYLYQAAVAQTRAMDYELQIDAATFDSLIKLGKQKAQGLIEGEPSSPWGHFFLGTAYGYDSYARVYRGDWFGGALQGFASVSEFKKAIACDSAMDDARAGIGTFYYWRSRRTAYFNWLPFLGDDRKEAYALIEQTIGQGTYNRFTAISMLVTICIDAGKYDTAAYYANLGLERYPENRMFLWGKATALQKAEKFGEAAEAYGRLLNSILSEKENNHYNEIVCRLNLVKVQLATGDSASVESQLRSILAYENRTFPERLQDRAKDKFLQAHDLQRELARDQGQSP